MAALCQLASPSWAIELTVPLSLQVDLLKRVVQFERQFASRASEPARVLIVQKDTDAASQRTAAQASAAIGREATLGGRAASRQVHDFSSLDALRAASSGSQIVYVMPGFSARELRAIADLFRGTGVITIGASERDADSGMVLAFQLESARPRIVINLAQARLQKLDFSAQLLRLARVVP